MYGLLSLLLETKYIVIIWHQSIMTSYGKGKYSCFVFEIQAETALHGALHLHKLVPQSLRPTAQSLGVHQELLQILQVGLESGRLLVLLVQFSDLCNYRH